MIFTDIKNGRFYNEDCFDAMREIPDGVIDMVLCDLPYGTTQNKGDYPGLNFRGWKPLRWLRQGGAIFLCVVIQFLALGQNEPAFAKIPLTTNASFMALAENVEVCQFAPEKYAASFVFGGGDAENSGEYGQPQRIFGNSIIDTLGLGNIIGLFFGGCFGLILLIVLRIR